MTESVSGSSSGGESSEQEVLLGTLKASHREGAISDLEYLEAAIRLTEDRSLLPEEVNFAVHGDILRELLGAFEAGEITADEFSERHGRATDALLDNE